MRVAIVTDSTADLTPQEAADHGIRVVPLQVIFGDVAYADGVDLTPAEFYRKLSAARDLPTTSQPSPGDFLAAFEDLLRSHDAVFGLFISARLSGTFEAAHTAALMARGSVAVMDSGLASYGLGLCALEGARLAREGAEPAAIRAGLECYLRGIREYILVTNLEMLRRGGRIGGAAALVGSILQVRPIITVKDGLVDVFEKVRTSARAVETMLSHLEADLRRGEIRDVAVIHTDALSGAEALLARVRELAPSAHARIRELGPVIGTHVGPGNVGLIYHVS